MTNPSPRPALRKAEDAAVHPAAPRPARTPRPPRAARPAADVVAPVPAPRTIADTNRDAEAAATARAAAGKPAKPAKPGKAAKAKPSGKKRKFSGSTSDHLRVPDTEFLEHPRPKGKPAKGSTPLPGSTSAARGTSASATGSASAKGGRSAARSASSSPAQDATATPRAVASGGAAPRPAYADLMKGKVVDLGARVPKKLRAAAREEAKRRGLDLDAVTTELLHDWLTRRD